MKIFRKTRQNSLKEGKTKNYLKYAIGEILLIVLGILIAMHINNWNSERINRGEAVSIYKNIKRQINTDKNAISINLKHNQFLFEKFAHGAQIIEDNDRTKTDTLVKIIFKLVDHSDIDVNSNIYQNLINSGESKLLKNRTIMQEIQKLEETYIHINRLEKIHYESIKTIGLDIHKSIKFHDESIRKPDKVFGIDFQNHCHTSLHVSYLKNISYNKAMKEIELITELIDEELK